MGNPVKKLAGGLMNQSDYVMRRYAAKIPVSHTLEDIERPEYFLHHVDTLARARREGPVKLEVISDDCSIHAEYLVLEATRASVRLRRIAVHHDEGGATEAKRPKPKKGEDDLRRFKEMWGGPKNMWRILENEQVVAKNIASKEAATEYTNRLNKGEMRIADIPEENAA
jgi:hypothetical protein